MPTNIAACIIMALTLNSCHTKKQAADTAAIANNTKSAHTFKALTEDSVSRMCLLDMELENVVVRFQHTPSENVPGLVATPPLTESQLAPRQQGDIVLTAARMKVSQRGKEEGRSSSRCEYSDSSDTDTRIAVSATEQSSSTGVYEPPTQGTLYGIVIALMIGAATAICLYRRFNG